MKKRLWIITELFLPDETSTAYIFGEIAQALSEQYEVNVICGPEVYDASKKVDTGNQKTLEGIKIFRVPGVKENKGNILSRIKKFILISRNLYSFASQKIETNDIVLLATNPFPLIIPISRLKNKRGFDLKVLVHDVFPDPLKIRMRIPNAIYTRLNRVFCKAYSRADLLISLGRDMTETLKSKTLRFNPSQQIIQIENWADTEGIRPGKREDFLPNNKIIIQYAGNLGKAQGIENLLWILNQSNNETLRLSLWGGGSEESKLKELSTSLGIDDKVSFNGTYLRSQQADVLNRCDIAIVSLREDIKGLGVPSKSYNILAAGKPILFIGPKDSEIALMIKENNIGFCFEEGETEEIIKFLNSLSFETIPSLQRMGDKARKVAEQKYSKEKILQKFADYI